jgi:hypothetical protein
MLTIPPRKATRRTRLFIKVFSSLKVIPNLYKRKYLSEITENASGFNVLSVLNESPGMILVKRKYIFPTPCADTGKSFEFSKPDSMMRQVTVSAANPEAD